MLAAIVISVIAVLVTNLIWIVRHNRIVANLKKAHAVELENAKYKEWTVAFKYGWNGALAEYSTVRKAYEDWQKKIDEM